MHSWKNWAGDETSYPARYLQPRTVEAVASAIRSAAEAGNTVRVVGAGHSFSDLVATDGVLINLDHLSGITALDVDGGTVTVGAGTRLCDLTPALAACGVALENLGDIDRQSVAGAVSTATHGTGRTIGNLATLINEVDLVLADGSTLHCDDSDAEVLAAARVSLGALGVATSYQLRVVPAFALHAVNRTMPTKELLASLDELVDHNDHFEFFAFPHADAALVKTNNRTADPARPPGRLAESASAMLENAVLDGACRIGRRFPARIPHLNRALTRFSAGADYIDDSYKVFASQRSVRFTEMEIAVPREACATVFTEIQQAIARNSFDVNFPIEVRFVAPDTLAHLSPSYGRETAYLAVHMFNGMQWQPYFQAVQDIALAHGGCPHWGKRHTLTADTLAGLYPAWDRFQSVRSRLDPHGVFTNEHIARVLGPTYPEDSIDAC